MCLQYKDACLNVISESWSGWWNLGFNLGQHLPSLAQAHSGFVITSKGAWFWLKFLQNIFNCVNFESNCWFCDPKDEEEKWVRFITKVLSRGKIGIARHIGSKGLSTCSLEKKSILGLSYAYKGFWRQIVPLFRHLRLYRIQPPGRRWPLWETCYLFEKSKLLFLTDYALKKSLLQGRHPIGCRNALVASFLGQRW